MRVPNGFRSRAALIGAAAIVASSLVALGGTALASSHASTPTPRIDIVGKGIFNCSVVTGEIGYSPALKSSGSTTAHERVSIWIKATKCARVPGTTATPIPRQVVTALSYLDNFGTTCPQLSGPIPPKLPFGTGVMDLSYNFPPVPVAMIDPSVAPAASVFSDTNPALWDIATTGVQDGSYVSSTFHAQIKPAPIGAQSCRTGLTSEYITRGTLTAV
jgi:hypothetical protein